MVAARLGAFGGELGVVGHGLNGGGGHAGGAGHGRGLGVRDGRQEAKEEEGSREEEERGEGAQGAAARSEAHDDDGRAWLVSEACVFGTRQRQVRQAAKLFLCVFEWWRVGEDGVWC